MGSWPPGCRAKWLTTVHIGALSHSIDHVVITYWRLRGKKRSDPNREIDFGFGSCRACRACGRARRGEAACGCAGLSRPWLGVPGAVCATAAAPAPAPAAACAGLSRGCPGGCPGRRRRARGCPGGCPGRRRRARVCPGGCPAPPAAPCPGVVPGCPGENSQR